MLHTLIACSLVLIQLAQADAQNPRVVKVWTAPGGNVYHADAMFRDCSGRAAADQVDRPVEEMAVDPAVLSE